MLKVPKRFLDRTKMHLRRYQKILESAKARDVNESDTVVIVTDFLADVLGYDKYGEITTEFAVRSTFCDLAIKIDGELRYLIEVKSAGTDLRDNHLRQAVDYAANQGIEAVILTNGPCWHVHRVYFEQPIRSEMVLEIDLLGAGVKPADLVHALSLLSREAANAGAMTKYWKQKEATSRFVVGQILLSEPVLRLISREIQTLSDVRVTPEHVADLLRNEVLKRDVLEGERAGAALKLVRRAARKRQKAPPLLDPTPVLTQDSTLASAPAAL